MKNDEFKSILSEFKYYLKPTLYTVLSENSEAFSEETKREIANKLMEAGAQMKEVNNYQEKRNGIMQKGLEKIEEIYEKAKAKFKAAGKADQESQSVMADQLISNL